MMKSVLLILTAVLLIPNFLPVNIHSVDAFNGKENYDRQIGHIRSIDELEFYTDSLSIENNIDLHSAEYFSLLEKTISARFYHGFSHYSLSENWIASAGQAVTGLSLASKVDPSEILKEPNAACSQQSIVMMEIIKRKEMDYRKVGFPHHYALEVNIKDGWYFYDCNMEPDMTIEERNHDSWKGDNDILKKYYNPEIHSALDYQFGHGQKATLGMVNAEPAPNLTLFQMITSFLSKFLWIFPFALWLRTYAPKFQLPHMFGTKQNLNPEFSL